KCLEKKAEGRYGSAIELADDLGRLLRAEPILARPIDNFERGVRWVRRNPAWATLIGGSTLALAVLAAAGVWFTNTLHAELKQTEAARREATSVRNDLRMGLTRALGETIDSDLRQLAEVPRVVAAALATREGWTDLQLTELLRNGL